MKITSFKTYQAVAFCGRNETWFDVEKQNKQQAAVGRSSYTVKELHHGLLISTDEEAVLATWNNIAFVNYDLSADESEQKTESKKELNVRKQKE
jgi:hypothetical protein